eukprot:3419031-Rhodomonas_salina.1
MLLAMGELPVPHCKRTGRTQPPPEHPGPLLLRARHHRLGPPPPLAPAPLPEAPRAPAEGNFAPDLARYEQEWAAMPFERGPAPGRQLQVPPHRRHPRQPPPPQPRARAADLRRARGASRERPRRTIARAVGEQHARSDGGGCRARGQAGQPEREREQEP